MAPRSRTTVWHFAVMAAVCLALAPAGDAAARKFQMSGTWVVRNGQVFLPPLQFAAFGMDVVPSGWIAVHASMGNLTDALGFPNDAPIPGQGGVTATGSAPATLRVPRHRFVEDAMALLDPGFSITQLTTHVGIDAPHASATLGAGLGPGSFTWCPGDPDCAAGGGMRSTDPPQGAGAHNGRVIYRAGANRFGGAMQLGLQRGSDLAAQFNVVPYRVGHQAVFGSNTALVPSVLGGQGSADAPSKTTSFVRRIFVTQPTMLPAPFGFILYPGPKLTTMRGLSTSGSGPIYYLPTVATGPMGTKAGEVITRYGFGQTTGTVIAQQNTGTGGEDFFTVMGSDARTPLGAGNLSLVAGGLSFRHNLAGETPYASFQKVKLTLGAPIPSLSPAGVAAAAALVLLAAGWALRRRF